MSYHLGLLTFTPRVDDISNIQNAMADELYLGMKTNPVSREIFK